MNGKIAHVFILGAGREGHRAFSQRNGRLCKCRTARLGSVSNDYCAFCVERMKAATLSCS
jgi:hypothetical protein